MGVLFTVLGFLLIFSIGLNICLVQGNKNSFIRYWEYRLEILNDISGIKNCISKHLELNQNLWECPTLR